MVPYKTLAGLAVGAVVALQAIPAVAEYPEDTITFIVGYDAGGGTDVMARTVAPFLEKYLGGAKVVVRNVPGAGGQIGWTQLAKAAPDGYTIANMNLPSMVAKEWDRETDYDLDSFTYLANIVDDPNVIVANTKSEFKSVADIVAAAKKTPKAITCGFASLGADDHFAIMDFQEQAGVELTNIPFGGGAPSRAAIMGGHVTIGVLNLSEAVKFQNKLRILGIFAPKRSKLAPDVPTVKEAGYDVVMSSMRGIAAPANLPAEVKAKLMAALGKLEADSEFAKVAKERGQPLGITLGDDYSALVHKMYDIAGKVWKKTPWGK